jgi:hypothetical protein
LTEKFRVTVLKNKDVFYNEILTQGIDDDEENPENDQLPEEEPVDGSDYDITEHLTGTSMLV